ncbi:pilus assembly protein PilY [Cupriavidus sp. 2TAF22]|uniref:pilus assembly protein PilY n=1 Tax=unclassified Cupriavidus TaxID=2640874 RepID=UPI003F8F6B3A
MRRAVLGCGLLVAFFAGLGAGAVQGSVTASRQSLIYIAEPGQQPGTGRLLALVRPATTAKQPPHLPAPFLPAWEAGARLAARDPDSRRLLSAQPDVDGAAARHLARLRRAPLARSPTGAQPVLVPPPAWMPGRPGHARFARKHAARPALVWLGTHGGLLHAFDAGTGEEVLAYAPGVLPGQAAPSGPVARGTLSAPANRPAQVPCPFPEAADVLLGPGRWRTVLLCGMAAITAARPGQARQAGQQAPAAVFALDITDTALEPPLGPLWEAHASPALPLAPAGPIRALALPAPDGNRWYAMVPLAPGGLALLPLDKPAHTPWLGKYAVQRLRLPASGCGAGTAGTALLAATVLSDAGGLAVAAYAVDDAGRLWRFDLRGPAPWLGEDGRCQHRLDTRASQQAAPPIPVAPEIISAPGGHLVVYGSGGDVAAVFEPATSANAQATGGWKRVLANPGERLERILPAAPGHLALVTRTPDARQRAYLLRALSGDAAPPGKPLVQPPRGQAVGADAAISLAATPLSPAPPSGPGLGARATVTLTLWSLEAGRATQLASTVASRRTGRLRWRELIRAGAP